MTGLHWMTAAEMSDAYAAGTLSPIEACRAVLAHIDAVDTVLNAFCHRDDDRVLADDAASEAHWRSGSSLSPLDGVSVSIKDLMWVEGWPCRYGSLASDNTPNPANDPAVEHMRGACCVVSGKVMTPEFGNSGVTDSPLTGLTVNPWDTGRTPGGSSGGSVAAVAAGCGPLSLGSDGSGSIRTPVSFTNLVGLKPTFGCVPQAPGEHFGRPSGSGPITRTVHDAAMMMNAMTRHWAGDRHSLPDDGATIPLASKRVSQACASPTAPTSVRSIASPGSRRAAVSRSKSSAQPARSSRIRHRGSMSAGMHWLRKPRSAWTRTRTTGSVVRCASLPRPASNTP